MQSPTVSTLKTLFALSGNRCAFPKCANRLVEVPSGTLVGKVCHIKGNSSGPGSKRYDKNQPDEERHGVGNLIAHCPKHHDIIDDDEESYTVERLVKMKADHEGKMREEPAASEALAEKFAVAIYNNTITGGSIIHTQNQSGGQTAHSIVNYHQPGREVGQAIADSVVAQLRLFPTEPFRVTSLSSDGGTMGLARKLDSILQLSGWQSQQNVSLAMCPDPVAGDVILGLPAPKPSYDALLALLRQAGLDARSEVRAGLKMLEITVASK
jgi:hypothetical protein